MDMEDMPDDIHMVIKGPSSCSTFDVCTIPLRDLWFESNAHPVQDRPASISRISKLTLRFSSWLRIHKQAASLTSSNAILRQCKPTGRSWKASQSGRGEGRLRLRRFCARQESPQRKDWFSDRIDSSVHAGMLRLFFSFLRSLGYGILWVGVLELNWAKYGVQRVLFLIIFLLCFVPYGSFIEFNIFCASDGIGHSWIMDRFTVLHSTDYYVVGFPSMRVWILTCNSCHAYMHNMRLQAVAYHILILKIELLCKVMIILRNL